MLFTVSLSEKLTKKGISSFSVHPGVIYTNLGRTIKSDEDWNMLKALILEAGATPGEDEATHGEDKEIAFKPLSEGVSTQIVAAFDPSIANHSGEYLLDGHLAKPGEFQEYAVDKANAAKLWGLSEQMVGEKFEY